MQKNYLININVPKLVTRKSVEELVSVLKKQLEIFLQK